MPKAAANVRCAQVHTAQQGRVQLLDARAQVGGGQAQGPPPLYADSASIYAGIASNYGCGADEEGGRCRWCFSTGSGWGW
eukprot:1360148-Rhodomonas_salina.2